MKNVHPTSTGGKRLDRFFIPAKSPDEEDDTFFRCHQCGFPNEKSKIQIGDAEDDMSSLQITTAVTLVTGGTTDVLELNESAQHGCAFCKSLNSDGHNLLKDRLVRSPIGYRG